MKRLWATTTSVFFALSVVGPVFLGVRAQSNDIAACPQGWEWNKNSLGQDPCAVATVLESSGCRGGGPFDIPPLNGSQNYRPPRASQDEELSCECNTVLYSLYMACGSCQGGVAVTWLYWITHCSQVYVAQYPYDIPFGTAVPRWAFFNVTTLANQTYDDVVARSIGRDPEALPMKSLSTSTMRTSRSTSTRKTPQTSSLSSSSISSPTPTNDGPDGVTTRAIVGGVVGGVVPLLITAAVLFWCLRRQRKREARPHSYMGSEYYTGQPGSPTLTATSTNIPLQHPWASRFQ